MATAVVATGITGGREEIVDVHGRTTGGFDLSLCYRNNLITSVAGGSKLRLPKAHSTGTTICGVVFKDGLVLGADTRATEGSTVCDKNCEKIHYIAPNIWCCGAGTSADTENVTGLVSQQLEMLRLSTGSQSRVITAMTRLKRHLFRYQGQVSAALVLGGVDCTGPHLYTVYPHGSTDKLPFVTMGSGSLAAMAVFEAGYKDGMTEEEAKKLVHQAIRSGIFNDLGSGGNVDLHVIRKDGSTKSLRNYETPNEASELRAQVKRPSQIAFPRGTTTVLRQSRRKHVVVVSEERTSSSAAMDTSA